MDHYNFEWDTGKAQENRRKHGVSFEQAATVFYDPRAASIYDSQHSGKEDRWITMGISTTAGLLVVHHTFQEIDSSHVRLRIFSCRKATSAEVKQYGD